MTRANADKKTRSKQRTRKAIVPLSIADDARGDDTFENDVVEEAEVETEMEAEEAEAEAARHSLFLNSRARTFLNSKSFLVIAGVQQPRRVPTSREGQAGGVGQRRQTI